MIHFRHRWQAAGVDHTLSRMEFTRAFEKVAECPLTEVLLRCTKQGCGALRTITLDGRWTLEQVRMEETCVPESIPSTIAT